MTFGRVKSGKILAIFVGFFTFYFLLQEGRGQDNFGYTYWRFFVGSAAYGYKKRIKIS